MSFSIRTGQYLTTVFLYVIKTNVGHYKSLYSLLYYILYLLYLELPPTHIIFTNYYTHCFVDSLLFLEKCVQYIVFKMHRPILTTVPFTNWLCKTLDLILQSLFFLSGYSWVAQQLTCWSMLLLCGLFYAPPFCYLVVFLAYIYWLG